MLSTRLYRSVLLDQIVALLKAANIVNKDKVFRNFPIKVPQENLPCIFVSAPQDRATALTVGPPVFMRTTTIAIQCFVNYVDIDGGRNQLDQLCYGIEQSIFCNINFQQKIEQIPSFKFDTVFHPDTGKQIAEARFEIDIDYREDFSPTGEKLNIISGVTT